MTASGGVPGIPKTSVGMKPPPTVALLADSVAWMPFGRALAEAFLIARAAAGFRVGDETGY